MHISVRAESRLGRRLNPRKTDLHRWRETFAAKLRERGIEAEATRQATRGATLRCPSLWQVKAGEGGRLLNRPLTAKNGGGTQASRDAAQAAWRELAVALATTGREADRQLAHSINLFVSSKSRQGKTVPQPEHGRHPPSVRGEPVR